jgi:hypothetical protein
VQDEKSLSSGVFFFAIRIRAPALFGESSQIAENPKRTFFDPDPDVVQLEFRD